VINDLTGNPSGIVFKQDKRLGDDPQRRQPDITRANTILNWTPTTGLQDGLAATIEYFRARINHS